MKEQSQLTLEERLAPKINQGEYLLVLVLALMLWMAGFVDLFTHTSQKQQVLGIYSWGYFIFLLCYSLGFVFWGYLIFPAESLTWFKQGIHFFQTRTLAGLAWFGGSAALLSSMFIWERWLSYPLLEASTALLIILFSAVILLARPRPEEPRKPYHKVILFIVGLIIALEATLQLLSFAGILPIQKYQGMFIPYGRVYQSEEGYANDTTNKYGWYYPKFRLAPGSRNIVLLGDSFVQGLQVPQDDLSGVQLDKLLTQTIPAGEVEVMSLGLPGLGPGFYLDSILYPYILDPLQPDEIVIFFHAANDFQTIPAPGGPIPFFVLNQAGEVDVTEQEYALRHDLWHAIIRGYASLDPVETVASHLFLFDPVDGLIQKLPGRSARIKPPTLNIDRASPQEPFGSASFMFSVEPDPRAEAAWRLTEAELQEAEKYAADNDITLRLVVIPYFPAEFFATKPNEGWDTRLGSHDVLLPEKRLQIFAQQNGIPFLGLGEYLEVEGFSLEEIQALFLNEGTGHFSTAGHAFVADALFTCFYSSASPCQASGP